MSKNSKIRKRNKLLLLQNSKDINKNINIEYKITLTALIRILRCCCDKEYIHIKRMNKFILEIHIDDEINGGKCLFDIKNQVLFSVTKTWIDSIKYIKDALIDSYTSPTQNIYNSAEKALNDMDFFEDQSDRLERMQQNAKNNYPSEESEDLLTASKYTLDKAKNGEVERGFIFNSSGDQSINCELNIDH